MASRNGTRGQPEDSAQSDLGPLDRRTVGFAAPEGDDGVVEGDRAAGDGNRAGRTGSLGGSDSDATGDTFHTLREVSKADRPNLGLPDDPAWQRLPVVMGYLCKQQYYKGRSRKASRCSLYATETGFVLNIPDEGMNKKLMVKCDHLEDILKVAEALLRSSDARWAVLGYGEYHNKLKAEEQKELAKRGQKL